MARPRFEPTDEQRKLVKSLAAIGVQQDKIADFVGLRSAKTLRRHFRQELDRGEAEASVKVAQTLYQMAASGKSATATIFWLKCRSGWRERPRKEGEWEEFGDVPQKEYDWKVVPYQEED